MSLSAGFVDLATHGAVDKFYYGGADAVTYFVRVHKKCTWFTQVPVKLQSSGSVGVGGETTYTISRAADYLLNCWLDCKLPAQTPAANHNLFWNKNTAHNLVSHIEIRFNDLGAMKIDNFALDFWSNFSVPASKRAGYNKMIGAGEFVDTQDGVTPQFVRGISAESAQRVQLPIPFFFSRDSGLALPTAALPYNDMTIVVTWATTNDAVISGWNNTTYVQTDSATGLGSTAKVTWSADLWANYAVVSNQERKLMGHCIRDMHIDQWQTTSTTFTGVSQSIDLRFSHGVKALMFGVQESARQVVAYANKPDLRGQAGAAFAAITDLGAGGDVVSNYSDLISSAAGERAGTYVARTGTLDNFTLTYENTRRLDKQDANFFNLVQPYYHAESVTTHEPGIYLYSYALDLMSCDSSGSTNYGKLTNVSVVPEKLATYTPGSAQFRCLAISHNVLRVSGGAVGFPVH